MNKTFLKSSGTAAMAAVLAFTSMWTGTVNAAAGGEPTARILLVGDSWTAHQWRDRVFRQALDERGLGEFVELGAVTAISGSTAAQWATPEFLALITAELDANPTVDIVHLSIGGNDFLSVDPSDIIAVITTFIQILRDTRTVADHIHALRPDVRIGYSIYDYINEGDGFATELALFTTIMKSVAANMRGFYLVNNLGVLHHAFGFPGAFGPGETPPPGGYPRYQPLQGGDPAFPGNPEVFVDAIHPTTAGYLALVGHAIDEFYGAWLGPQLEVETFTLDGDPIIDPTANEIVAVIVYGSSAVDTADVAPGTVAYGPLGASPFLLPNGLSFDANGDSVPDRGFLFRTGNAGFTPGEDDACIQYDRNDAVATQGCSTVLIAR